MTRRCQYCANLNVDLLVGLAQKEFRGRVFPKSAFYKHHSCFHDLEQSADDGCELCQLIINCFRGVEEEGYFWPRTWKGQACDVNASMYAAAKQLAISDVKVAIDAATCYTSDEIEYVNVFDTLMIQVGISEDAPLDPDAEDSGFPTLCLTLSLPRGTYKSSASLL